MPFTIVVGVHSSNRAIGAKGKIPWKCKADMKFFKELTTHTSVPDKVNAVIMGRTTYESIGKPLPNRLNAVLSRKNVEHKNFFYKSLDETIETFENNPNVETIFVIGGENVYKQAIDHPKCEKIYLNMIGTGCTLSDCALSDCTLSDCALSDCALSECDAFFPEIDPTKYKLINTQKISEDVTGFLYKKI